MNYTDVINFWFIEHSKEDWFKKNDVFDKLISDRFSIIHDKARAGGLFAWREFPHGVLAEIIVLDQFSRNIYRNTPEAFASDNLALVLAQNAIVMGVDEKLSNQEKMFLYLPFMHSESIAVHNMAQTLFQSTNDENLINFANEHMDIIKRFGRYPHRNTILNRVSTKAEVDFLQHHQGF